MSQDTKDTTESMTPAPPGPVPLRAVPSDPVVSLPNLSSPTGAPSSPGAPAGGSLPVARPTPQLPEHYGVDRLVLLVRDPSWLYAYWDVSEATWSQARRLADSPVSAPAPGPRQPLAAPGGWERSRTILRLNYVAEPAAASGRRLTSVWETEVNGADNWYIHWPERRWPLQAELLQRLADGREIPLLRSNLAFLPPVEPSALVDEEWLTIEEVWERFVGLAPGAGSEELLRSLRARWQQHLASPGFPTPALMSPGFSPGFSWGRAPTGAVTPAAPPLTLTVATDLVLYGQSDPSAQVRVGDTPVARQADGSFRLQFTLEDGELVLPVTTYQPQTGQSRQITVTVQRRQQ